jgi:hypothetical protein
LAESPVEAAIGAPDARDVLADPLFQNRQPRDDLEAEPVFDQLKAPADERGCGGEASTDIFAHLRWDVGEAALCRHLAADALGFALLKNGYRATWDLNGAILCGDIAHFDKAAGAAIESVLRLSAKAAICDRQPLPGGQLMIKPGGSVAADLPFEVQGGECTKLEPSPPLGKVIALAARDDVVGHLPAIVIDPLDTAGPAQRPPAFGHGSGRRPRDFCPPG